MAKGGETSTTTKLSPEIEKAALENLDLAKKVGAIPYAPYFGPSIAAFAPAQEASFKNADQAAGAFGLPGGAAGNMPKPQNVGGFKGYSTEPMYKDAMSQVPQGVLDMINAFFGPDAYKKMFGGGGSGTKPPGMNPAVAGPVPGTAGLPAHYYQPGNLNYYDGGH